MWRFQSMYDTDPRSDYHWIDRQIDTIYMIFLTISQINGTLCTNHFYIHLYCLWEEGLLVFTTYNAQNTSNNTSDNQINISLK